MTAYLADIDEHSTTFWPTREEAEREANRILSDPDYSCDYRKPKVVHLSEGFAIIDYPAEQYYWNAELRAWLI
jgi:hypothetical protein